MRRKVVAGFLGVAWASISSADVVALTSQKDNTIFEDPDGLYSNGAGQFMFVGETRAANTRRGLLMFDIASVVPAGAIINSATLQLHCSRSASGSRLIQARRLTSDWGEGLSDSGDPGGGGAFSTPGDASWIHSVYPATLWSTPGGDFVGTTSTQVNVSGTGFYTFPSSSLMVSDVQGFLNNPATNFGWLLFGPENGGTSAKRFDTHENIDPAFRPKLVIDYTIPEPATGMILIAAAWMLRRR